MWHLYHQRNLVMQIWKRKCFVECRKTNYLSVDCSLRYLLSRKTTLTWIINYLYGLPSYLVSKAGKCRDVDIDTTLVWRDSVSCRRLVGVFPAEISDPSEFGSAPSKSTGKRNSENFWCLWVQATFHSWWWDIYFWEIGRRWCMNQSWARNPPTVLPRLVDQITWSKKLRKLFNKKNFSVTS